jgi:hypothetical protein
LIDDDYITDKNKPEQTTKRTIEIDGKMVEYSGFGINPFNVAAAD